MSTFTEFVLAKVLKEKRFSLPAKLLRTETVQEFDRALQTGNAMAMVQFYDSFMTPDKLNTKFLKELNDSLNNKRDLLTEDDRKIIKFFVDIGKEDPYYFFDIGATSLYLAEVVTDLDKASGVSDNLRMAVMLWLYLSMYELVLDILTNKLYSYYKKHPPSKDTIKEIEKKISDGDHLTAGNLEHILKDMKVIPLNHKSFLEDGRIFRNKIGHANIFYDDKIKKLVFVDGKMYSTVEFDKEFKLMQQFLLEWIYIANNRDSDISKTIVGSFSELADSFLRIERSGILKKEYGKLIIDWREEHEKEQ